MDWVERAARPSPPRTAGAKRIHLPPSNRNHAHPPLDPQARTQSLLAHARYRPTDSRYSTSHKTYRAELNHTHRIFTRIRNQQHRLTHFRSNRDQLEARLLSGRQLSELLRVIS